MTMSWRHMSVSDIKGLQLVAEAVHPGLPESDHIFEERVNLFPEGCLVLVQDGAVQGYAISYPIRHGQPPALDTLLGEIPADADQYYIHDLAILPVLRGRGLAAECIDKLLNIAKRYPTTCLVSVYGTSSFWGRYGFVSHPMDSVLAEKLHGYGGDATFMVRLNRFSS